MIIWRGWADEGVVGISRSLEVGDIGSIRGIFAWLLSLKFPNAKVSVRLGCQSALRPGLTSMYIMHV
jgi:hypothetical protein